MSTCPLCSDRRELVPPNPTCPICRADQGACAECASVRDPQPCPRCHVECGLCAALVPEGEACSCGARACDDCAEWAQGVVQTSTTRTGSPWRSCPDCRAEARGAA